MKRKELLLAKPCDPPEENSNDVTGVTQIVTVDNKEYLDIDLFVGDELRGRYFADNEMIRHVAYVDSEWTENILENVVRKCLDQEAIHEYSWFNVGADFAFATLEDENRAEEYLGADIYWFERAAGNLKMWNKRERRIERIYEMMKEIPRISYRVYVWMEEKVFPGHFLFFTRQGKKEIYECTFCGARGETSGLKNGKMVKCPSCGLEVKADCRRLHVTKKAPVVVLQEAGESRWVERQFTARCTWANGKKQVELFEEERAIMDRGRCLGNVMYGQVQQADEILQEWYDGNPLNKRFRKSYLYPENLREVLPYGGLEHSGLEILANNTVKVNVNRFITGYHQNEYLEYLIKRKFTKLAVEIVDQIWIGDYRIRINPSVIETLQRLDGNRKARLRQLNGGVCILLWLGYEQETEGEKPRITQESLEYLDKAKIDPGYCGSILDDMDSVNRMVNYLRKNNGKAEFLRTWKDYLRMAEREGYDTEDDIVRFPKNMKERHDELVERSIARQRTRQTLGLEAEFGSLDRKIEKRLPEIKYLFWENEEYMIIPAGKCEELQEEGRQLHHCVGSSDRYMRKMAGGKSWICFLRKKADLEKPYYTLEVSLRDDEIIQWYSAYDRKPDKEKIQSLLTKYVAYIKRERLKRADNIITSDIQIQILQPAV